MFFNFNNIILQKLFSWLYLFLINLFFNCLCHQQYFNNYQNLSNPFLYTQQQQPTVYLTFGSHPLSFHYGYPQNSNNQQRLSNSYPCISRCQPYRWTTYRWNGAIPSNRPQQPHTTSSPSPTTTTIPPEPSPIVVQLNNTLQQIQSANIQGALIRLIFHTTTLQTTTNPIVTSSVVSELPTPPPYTQNVPGDVSSHRQNPCPDGQPLINGLHNPMTCNFVVKPNGGCPDNYWCHTGASYETTTCCPYNDHSKSRCQLPRAGGTGDELIPRWYFDTGAHKCKRFLYRGMHGNANNFVTAMSCSETCENSEYLASATRNPCSNGWPARDLAGKQFLCGTSDSRCPAGYFCHLGELATLNVCCELSTAASNRCNLALRIGEGIGNLKRFYFNTLTRKCTEFVYKGIKGNENSFLTNDECKAICEKLPNPCPMHYDLGERKECSGTDGQSCGRGEWCHIGSRIETTACCPAAVVDICKLPLDLGQGIENLTRWYAVNSEDPCMRECRPFQYRGMKGNQNNFQTKTECEARCKSDCPISLNPCSENGQLLLNKEGKPHRCNSTKSGKCPPNYWCHIGANVETTVCCSSGAGKPCNQSLSEGFGNALLSRWYYNFKEGNCQKFIYRGIGGNRNNYVDYDDCMNACPDSPEEEEKTTISTTSFPTTTQTTFLPKTTLKTKGIRKIKIIPKTTKKQLVIKEINLDNPCSNGNKPLLNTNNLPFECSPEQRCPDTHFCHISDIKYLSQKCCPKNGEPCIQPLSEGEGISKLERFYFDSIKRRCRPFIYRGAFGNANNFLFENDCEYVCSAFIHPNPCSHGHPLPIDEYNNNQPLVCGNSEFIDFSLSDASVISSGCPSGYWCHVGSSPDTTNCCPHTPTMSGNNINVCDLKLELGNGTERLDRWYFDSSVRKCRRFWYTGLKGNRNNFLSREHCQQICEDNTNIYSSSSSLPDDILQQQGQINGKWLPKVLISKRNFCLRGEPLINSFDGNLIKCGEIGKEEGEDDEENNKCPDTHYCHIGNSNEESGCCLKSGNDRCLLPLNRGVNIGNWNIRWHFNVATGNCEVFDYAGTRGNENNFITKKLCEKYCIENKKTKKLCPHGEPKLESNGRTLEHKKCGLNSSTNTDCGEGFLCHFNTEGGTGICCEDPAYFCLRPRDPGHCTENQIRYGYNPMTDTCVSYRYSGCGGTLNKFETFENCKEICCRQYIKKNKMR